MLSHGAVDLGRHDVVSSIKYLWSEQRLRLLAWKSNGLSSVRYILYHCYSCYFTQWHVQFISMAFMLFFLFCFCFYSKAILSTDRWITTLGSDVQKGVSMLTSFFRWNILQDCHQILLHQNRYGCFAKDILL